MDIQDNRWWPCLFGSCSTCAHGPVLSHGASLDAGLCMQIVTVDEAKTFYPLFGLGANVALIFSGRAVKYFSQVTPAPC